MSLFSGSLALQPLYLYNWDTWELRACCVCLDSMDYNVYYERCNLLQASLWYGLVVHFRIYPIIYSIPILLVLSEKNLRLGLKPALNQWDSIVKIEKQEFDSGKARHPSEWRRLIFKPLFLVKIMLTREGLLFGVLSGGFFLFWTNLFFYLYGWEFLNESLLYHLTRVDPRHNFSIYFYHIYLHHQYAFSIAEKLMSFLPQILVQGVLISCFAQDLPFCFFVQTVAFVAFNKVITAQYFVWFFCLLPLILPWSNINFKWQGLLCIVVWMVGQMHWLLWGYMLEFKGRNVFVQLWLASIVFLAANTFVLIQVICHHRFTPLLMEVHSARKNK